MSELKEGLYGKTAALILADGKTYTAREPNIATIEDANLDIANLSNVKNLRKMIWLVLKEDNPGLSEEKIGKLVTFSMLKDSSSFMKSVFLLLGVDEKNELAGESK